jgi:hypothetical protein
MNENVSPIDQWIRIIVGVSGGVGIHAAGAHVATIFLGVFLFERNAWTLSAIYPDRRRYQT